MSSFKLIAPYAAWMLLMMVLPSSAISYAVRTIITAALLVFACWRHKFNAPLKALVWGVPIGLLVFVIWILPEQFDWPWYRKLFIIGEGGTQAVQEANTLLLVTRLIGSAFVIAVAEELFFRRWLIEFAGFWWMVGLFAIEHDRWLVGAIAGIIYGLIYLRKGLGAAIVAHVITNLVLGLWVLRSGQWQFW